MNYELGIRNKKKLIPPLFILITFIAATIVTAHVFAANQVKTTETFIIGSDASVSSATSSSFSLYIGDNLSGVTNPVKSAQVAVSGVYTSTAQGSITVQLGSDSQIFTMAHVGSSSPTPFEIFYDASSTTASISSAGTYEYTLTVTPSAQVTIYGLGAKMAESHEYAPGSCPDGQPANEKIKTTETFIIGSDASVSSATSSSFSLYIGDNLSGVTNPVKSAQVAVSGVYTSTAQGSITVQLGSDSQIFTMAHVGSSSPTPFEIFYDASSTTASISSAGTYNYTLTVTPSAQVTIYGLGAKMAESHRYKPSSCGAGYAATGSIESSTFDTGVATGAAYNSIIWTGALGAGGIGRVRLQLATSDSSSGPWTYYGDSDGDGVCATNEYYEPSANASVEIGCESSHNNKRYFRYKTTLCSANDCSSSGETTPRVDDVIINWSP